MLGVANQATERGNQKLQRDFTVAKRRDYF